MKYINQDYFSTDNLQSYPKSHKIKKHVHKSRLVMNEEFSRTDCATWSSVVWAGGGGGSLEKLKMLEKRTGAGSERWEAKQLGHLQTHYMVTLCDTLHLVCTNLHNSRTLGNKVETNQVKCITL